MLSQNKLFVHIPTAQTRAFFLLNVASHLHKMKSTPKYMINKYFKQHIYIMLYFMSCKLIIIQHYLLFNILATCWKMNPVRGLTSWLTCKKKKLLSPPPSFFRQFVTTNNFRPHICKESTKGVLLQNGRTLKPYALHKSNTEVRPVLLNHEKSAKISSSDTWIR
jgi:hypothetical protein